MRSKKLARQLKKSLECEEIDDHLQALQEWFTAHGAAAPEGMSFVVNNFSPFLDAIDQSYEQYETNLKHAQTSLELSGKEVEERNKLLRGEVKKVSDLLNNMRQAVFSVGPDGVIVAPVSKFADHVFGRALAGANMYEAVYPELDQKGEEFANLKSAMIGVYGEAELQWFLMEESFPRRSIIYLPGAEKTEDNLRVLKIGVGPIWNDVSVLERIMFIVEDVTEVEKLERKMAEEKAKANRNMQIIQEMVGLARPQLSDFLARTTGAMHETRRLMDANGNPDLDLLFRELHTVKGNARGYKFSLISAAAHRVESLIAACRGSGGPTEWSSRKTEVLAEMHLLQDQIAEYVSLAQRILGIDVRRTGTGAGASGGGSDAKNQITQLVERVRPVLAKLRTQIKHPGLGEVHEMLERATDTAVAPVLERLAMMANDVATELSKNILIEVADPGQIAIPPKLLGPVHDALMHLVRNAVDHGLEPSPDREVLGKPQDGHLRLAVDGSQSGFVSFSIQDDGRGLDASSVVSKAIALGIVDEATADSLAEKEKYDLIFRPGFTTKQEANETSGRGVGLDAARSMIEKIGGRIEIHTKKGNGTTFQIIIPTPAFHEALPVTG
jgi:signal transduction histidine kinase